MRQDVVQRWPELAARWLDHRAVALGIQQNTEYEKRKVFGLALARNDNPAWLKLAFFYKT